MSLYIHDSPFVSFDDKHEGSYQSNQKFNRGRLRPSRMVRCQHWQEPKQWGQLHRCARQELGRVYRFAGSAEACDSGENYFRYTDGLYDRLS